MWQFLKKLFSWELTVHEAIQKTEFISLATLLWLVINRTIMFLKTLVHIALPITNMVILSVLLAFEQSIKATLSLQTSKQNIYLHLHLNKITCRNFSLYGTTVSTSYESIAPVVLNIWYQQDCPTNPHLTNSSLLLSQYPNPKSFGQT